MYSLSLNLKSLSNCKIWFSGRFINAWLLRAIKNHDEKLADELHNSKRWPMSPYSIKPLTDGSKMVRSVRKGREYTVMISLLDDSLVEPFVVSLTGIIDDEVKLGECYFKLISIFGDTWKPKTFDAGSVLVRFKSPTFFKLIGYPRNILYPIPRGILGTAMRLWNTFVREEFNKEDLDELANKMIVERYSIRTLKPINLSKNRKIVGFVGSALYTIQEDRELINKLLSFAEFSNIGGSRTLGFGFIEVSYHANKNA